VRYTAAHGITVANRRSLFSTQCALLLSAWHRPHRDLHSFPTRRSSDLHLAVRAGPGDQRPQALGQRHCTVADHQQPCSGAAPGRSEEHTSELQSRENLVCRLLLEKKKRKEGRSGSSLAVSRSEASCGAT